MSERITLSRAKGWRMPPNTVKVDRSTQWGNPFSAQAAEDWGFTNKANANAFVVQCFEVWVSGDPRGQDLWRGPESDAARARFADLSPLRGKNLACWCRPDQPCHADVLLRLANPTHNPTQEP